MPYGRRGGEFAVNAQLVGHQTTPSIAGFASGGFIVVWSTTDTLQDGAGRAIKAQRYDAAGNAVGPEILINTSAAGDQRAPSVTTLASGGYVVTWETTDTNQDGSGTAIKGQLFDSSGAAVGAEFRVNSQLAADQTRSSVTGLEGGGFVVTWQTADSTQDGHTTAIKGQIYSAAGVAVGGEFLVNTGAVGAEMSPDVTSLDGGGFVATWTLGSGTIADIYAQVFDSSGARVGSQFRVNSTTPYNQDNSSVTQLSDGRFVVTWKSAASLTSGDVTIQARIFSASGTPIGNEFLVSTTHTDPDIGYLVHQSTPNVEHLPDGGFVITWLFAGGGANNSSIRAQYFDASGARVGGEVIVSTVTNRFEWDPEVAVDGNGILLTVWSSHNSSAADEDIRGQYYVPEGAPEIVSDGGGSAAALTVAENQIAVTTIVATDPEGSTLTYSIVGGADAARFAIDPSTGVLTFVQARNFESKQDVGGNNVYDVVVSVSDGVNTDLQTLRVAISNVNEGVTLTGGQGSYYYIENGTGPVADFNATDADGDPVTYSLSGADAALFTIDSAGVVRFAASPNYEVRADAGANNIYDLTVTASDGSLSSSHAMTVEVLNQNEAPYIVSGGGGDSYALSVAENTGFVMTVVTADPDSTPSPVTYAIVGGADASRFVINSNGQLFFTSGRNFEAPTDIGANNVYDVIVSVSDGFNPADTQAIAVTVTNVNEAVTITSNGGGASANVSVAENGHAVTTVFATDLDGTTPTYAIAGGVDAALFTIDSVSGALSFIAAPNRESPGDAGGNNVYDVIVSASDGSLADTQAIAVTVTNVDEDILLDPLGAFSVSENDGAVGSVSATDPDGGAILYSIAGGADSALFRIDSATGVLSFVSAPNFEAPADAGSDNVYDVVVAASDGVFAHTQVVTVTVVNADEGVTIGSDGGGDSASVSVTENGVAVTVVAATDADGGPVSYAISGGADAARFTIDSATGALTFVDAPDFEAPGDAGGDNVYDLVVTASDGSMSDSQAIAVTIVNADEPIVFTSASAVVRPENADASHQVVAVDPDGGAAMSYSIVGGADSSLFWIHASTGLLTYIGIPDHELPADADGDNVYEIVVEASNGSNVATQAIAFTVSDVNEAPRILSNGGGTSASVNIDEGETAITTIVAADGEGSPVTYAIAGGADADRFAIDSVTGVLSLVAAPDYEAPVDAFEDNFYTVIVSASDGELSSWQSVQVMVNDVNEGVSITSGTAFSVVENGTAVTIVTASDLDGTAPTFSIVGGADSALFAIDAATGALSFLSAPNFEAPADAGGDNVYDVVVAASDGALGDTRALTVSVTNANEGVTIVGAQASCSVLENGTNVATFAAIDADGDSLTFSIAGADAGLFAIDSATGALSFLSAPNFEAPADSGADNVYDVIVSASDGSLSASHALTVVVQDRNEGPIITSGGGGDSFALSVEENAFWFATVTAADPDSISGPIVYSIVGGADAAHFSIYSSTGALFFATMPDREAPADSDGDNVYEVIVAAGDGSNPADTQLMTIAITDVNERPRFVGSNGTSVGLFIDEGQSAVATFAAVDPEGSTVAYSISGGSDAHLFTIDSSTGALSLVQAPDYEAPLDLGEDNLLDVIVTASDGTLDMVQLVHVTVRNVNEGLSIDSPAAVTAIENGLAAATVSAVDVDGDPIAYAIAGGADAARFTIDSATGALSFVSAPDHEAPGDSDGDNVYQVTVSASDGSFTDTKALAVTVANANDVAPVIVQGDGLTLNVSEGQTFLLDIDASDAEGDPVGYGLSGADAGLFAIDPATGALRFLAAPDFEAPGSSQGTNVYHLTVIAGDGLLQDTLSLVVQVGNVNEGLSITSSPTHGVAENGTAVATVTAVDQDGTAPVFSIAGGADAALFAIDSATGALRFLSAPDFEAPGDAGGDNVYDVVVAAGDGGFTDSRAMTVTVSNVNEGVSIISDGGGSSASVSVAENGLSVTNVAALDADGAPVVYAIAGGADAARFTIDSATGALRFVAVPDFEAPSDSNGDNVYELVVSASDGVFTDSQALAVSVTNVNEGVTIGSGGGGSSASYSVAENSLAVATIAASDADGNALIYAIAGGADSARFTIDAATGALSFVSAPNHEAPADSGADNVYDVIVSASDGSFTDTQALAVTVTNVREGNTIVGSSGGNTISTTTTVSGQPRATELEDTIYGMGGHDNISGAGGDDIIDGGLGNDTITGGLGADVLTGGAGADRFTYNSVAESVPAAPDLITDFSRAQSDRISLSAIDANSLASNNQAFTFIGANAFSGVAGQLRYEFVDGNTLVTGDVNGDRVADFAIELTGQIALISSDFIL